MIYQKLISLLSVSLISCLPQPDPFKRYFVCDSGALLPIDQLCDGRIDCYDGSDEKQEHCYRIVCTAGLFRCQYGACINRSQKCNGLRDCADGSDETQCGRKLNSCNPDEFRCGNGQCTRSIDICNSIIDCLDGSDEKWDSGEICHRNLCPLGSFRCHFGGCVDDSVQCDGFRDCLDGTDESDILCASSQHPEYRKNIKCNPIINNRVDVSCELNGVPVFCNRPIEPGTIAKYSCKNYFIPSNSLNENNVETECQADGVWSNDILDCIPDCGHLNPALPLVVNGWRPQRPFPWHVTMYIRNFKEYKFWCGASLISESVVITAGHCVWDIDPSVILIVFGSTHKYLNESNFDTHSQYFTARRIIRHPFYMDKYGNYGSDIALIELSETIEFTDWIHPVCIDWELNDITTHLADQSLGIVMGMGVTEDNEFSTLLRAVTIPVVSNRKCLASQQLDFRKYITFTTFCGGWTNGSGVCNGDSGGGLVFKKRDTDQWCLQGIVSLSPRRPSTVICDPQHYTVFTKVGIYVRWIRNVLRDIHHNQNDQMLLKSDADSYYDQII